jgi:hypothetical protein
MAKNLEPKRSIITHPFDSSALYHDCIYTVNAISTITDPKISPAQAGAKRAGVKHLEPPPINASAP